MVTSLGIQICAQARSPLLCIHCTISDACPVLVIKPLQTSAYLFFRYPSRLCVMDELRGSKTFETLTNYMITRSLQHNSTTTCLFLSVEVNEKLT